MVQGVDAGWLFGIEVCGGGPFDAAVRAHADGEAVLGDQRVIERAEQAHCVDVGQPAVLVLIEVVHLRPLHRRRPHPSLRLGHYPDSFAEDTVASTGKWSDAS